MSSMTLKKRLSTMKYWREAAEEYVDTWLDFLVEKYKGTVNPNGKKKFRNTNYARESIQVDFPCKRSLVLEKCWDRHDDNCLSSVIIRLVTTKFNIRSMYLVYATAARFNAGDFAYRLDCAETFISDRYEPNMWTGMMEDFGSAEIEPVDWKKVREKTKIEPMDWKKFKAEHSKTKKSSVKKSSKKSK